MKPTFTRRYRRRSTPARTEGAFFKKESQEFFFGGTEHETFFQPAVTVAPAQSIHRKCEKCEEEKKVQRAEDKKEEEKKVMKKEDKKEEEKVMKKEDKKEEEKVMKMEEKKEEEKKVQRAEDKKEEEKVMKKEDKKEEEKVMKMGDKKEEEKMMKMEDKKDEGKAQKKETDSKPTPGKNISNYVSALSGKGQSLPAQTNYFFSSKMGYDFSNVKLHTDKEAAESAKGINAKVYTVGNNIIFNKGQFDTQSSEGKKLIAHELTHVMQQGDDTKIKRQAAVAEPAVEAESTFARGRPGYSFNWSGEAANENEPNPNLLWELSPGSFQPGYMPDPQDDSWEAMIYRSNKADAREYAIARRETPVLTTERGGEAPDFNSKKWQREENSHLGNLDHFDKKFHIIDKIEYDFSLANSEDELLKVYHKYQDWLIIPYSAKVCRVDDLPFIPRVYSEYMMFKFADDLNPNEIRNAINKSFVERLKTIKTIQNQLNLAKALAEAEEVTLKGKRKEEGPCIIKSVARKGGNQMHNTFAEYVALVKGAFLTAAAETEFTTPEGVSYSFDVFNFQTNQAFEVKTRHQWAGDMLIAGTMYWPQFINRAVDMDIQRLKGLYVANRCGIGFRYVFDNCSTMLGMRKQWSNIPPVEYIPYPGDPKENCS